MDHWTQAYNTCSAGECPAQIWWPNPTYVQQPQRWLPLACVALTAVRIESLRESFRLSAGGMRRMAMAGLPGNYIDWWCTDKPCYGRNGTEFVMGNNGQVVGRDHDYTDW